MIVLDNVTKSFRRRDGGRQILLDHVSLTLPHRRRLGVLGRNGAGKSTLLRMLAGSETIDSGRIRRYGRVSFPVGFTGTFHPPLTARENLRFLARIYNTDVTEVCDWVEDFAELGPYFEMPVATYSSGMFARLAVGCSFAFEFETYLVDEVIEVGDEPFRAKCTAAFEARLSDASLVLVSHNADNVRRYCDCAALMHDGRIELFTTVEAAFDAYEADLRRSASTRTDPGAAQGFDG